MTGSSEFKRFQDMSRYEWNAIQLWGKKPR